MATVTKTFTENQGYSSVKATWTVSVTGANQTVTGSSFMFPAPTVTAKYVCSGRGYGTVDVVLRNSQGMNNSYMRSYGAMASGTTYTLSDSYKSMIYTSDIFNSANKNSRTYNFTASSSAEEIILSSENKSGSDFNQYVNASAISWGTIATITLNAPPTFTATTTSSGTYYTGLSTYTVNISSLSAKYGGTISSAVLTVGSQTASRTTNGTLSISLNTAGTFTPSVKVTDSRGQVTTKNLTAITVSAYSKPSLDFNVFRSDSNGVRADEGAYGLITADVIFTDAVADINKPTVKINGTNTNNVTWYSAYNSSTGVSSAISDWTTVASGDTVYGLINGSFSQMASYQITVSLSDTLGGTSSAITQTLSTAFYTIDFRAGGKEIAFGGPAIDNLTSHPDGLFRCNMDTLLNGPLECNNNVKFNNAVNPITVSNGSPPYYKITSTQIDLTASPPSSGDIHDQAIRAYDANGTRIGQVEVYRTVADVLGTAIQVARTVNGELVHNTIAMRLDANGNMSYTVGSPSAFRSAIGITRGTTTAITTPAGSYTDYNVTFGKTYSSNPTVIVGFVSSSTAGAFGRCSCSVHSITTTGCTVRVFNGDTTQRAPNVSWVAVGD